MSEGHFVPLPQVIVVSAAASETKNVAIMGRIRRAIIGEKIEFV